MPCFVFLFIFYFKCLFDGAFNEVFKHFFERSQALPEAGHGRLLYMDRFDGIGPIGLVLQARGPKSVQNTRNLT